jgi:hypothetical protein
MKKQIRRGELSPFGMTFGLREVGENAQHFRMIPLGKSHSEHGEESPSSENPN